MPLLVCSWPWAGSKSLEVRCHKKSAYAFFPLVIFLIVVLGHSTYGYLTLLRIHTKQYSCCVFQRNAFKYAYKIHFMATSNPPGPTSSSCQSSGHHFLTDFDQFCENALDSTLLHASALCFFFPTLGCLGYIEVWRVNLHETTLPNDKVFSLSSKCKESWTNFIRLLRRSTG